MLACQVNGVHYNYLYYRPGFNRNMVVKLNGTIDNYRYSHKRHNWGKGMKNWNKYIVVVHLQMLMKTAYATDDSICCQILTGPVTCNCFNYWSYISCCKLWIKTDSPFTVLYCASFLKSLHKTRSIHHNVTNPQHNTWI